MATIWNPNDNAGAAGSTDAFRAVVGRASDRADKTLYRLAQTFPYADPYFPSGAVGDQLDARYLKAGTTPWEKPAITG